jgi:hypothetical protein
LKMDGLLPYCRQYTNSLALWSQALAALKHKLVLSESEEESGQ